MKITHLILISFLFLARGFGEDVPMMTALDSKVNESSGLAYVNDKIITHNDSDEEPELYEVNPKTGKVLRTVVVKNVKNHDWEDITTDENYIYIGDFGNNLGNRKNLQIYKISKKDFHNKDSVTAEKIKFSYANQLEFTPARFNSNFDAEALVNHKDHLYIFTKNWKNKETDVYRLSKQPGEYILNKVNSIKSEGLITGGDYDEKNNQIVLTGNGVPTPFILVIRNFENSDFSKAEILKHNLEPQFGASIQIEGITMINKNECLLSAEKSVTGASALYKFNLKKSPTQFKK